MKNLNNNKNTSSVRDVVLDLLSLYESIDVETGVPLDTDMNNFVSSLGFRINKSGKLKPKRYEKNKNICPKCGRGNASYVEIGADTDYNDIVLECPDCGYSEDNVLKDKNHDFSVGDIIDTRKTNRDFRRFCARIRRINKDGTALVEYVGGDINDYKIDSGVKLMSLETMSKFYKYVQKNIDKGSLGGPTAKHVEKTLSRWLKIDKNT